MKTLLNTMKCVIVLPNNQPLYPGVPNDQVEDRVLEDAGIVDLLERGVLLEGKAALRGANKEAIAEAADLPTGPLTAAPIVADSPAD